jgi:glycosyltransferase involved in cell wall biosynthesis
MRYLCHMSLHISVITAVLNRAATLGAALRTVHEQTWPNVEHLVIDGGSTDGTLSILARHRPRLAQLISEPDRGLYDALNKGIRRASGDVIGFLHADDELASPQVLRRVAAAFENPAVDAVYGDLVYVDKVDPSHVVRYWKAGAYERANMEHGWMPPHPTFYVRREVYERLGDFDLRYRISADYDSILRILWRGRANVAYIPEVLVRMRTGGLSGSSLWNLLRKSREDYAAMRQNGIGGLHALVLKNVTKLPQFVLPAAMAR